jgi:hypothetical protein
MSENLIALDRERAELPDAEAPCTAELAGTCTDFCERDHDNE